MTVKHAGAPQVDVTISRDIATIGDLFGLTPLPPDPPAPQLGWHVFAGATFCLECQPTRPEGPDWRPVTRDHAAATLPCHGCGVVLITLDS